MSEYQFLKPTVLTKLVHSFQPSGFRGLTMFDMARTISDSFTFEVLQGSQLKADHRPADAPAGIVANLTRKRVRTALATVREKKRFRESTLRWFDVPGKIGVTGAEEAITREMEDLNRVVMTAWEYMAWQLLLTGAITLSGEEPMAYDFGLTHTDTYTVPWSTIATSDPFGDIDAAKQLIRQDSGRTATDIYMGSTSMRYIFESTNALLVLGNGTRDQYAVSGTVPILADLKVHLVDDGYKNAAGTFKYFLSDDGVAANMVLIKAAGSVGEFAEGPAVDPKASPGTIGKFAKSYETDDPGTRFGLITHSGMIGLELPNNIHAGVAW